MYKKVSFSLRCVFIFGTQKTIKNHKNIRLKKQSDFHTKSPTLFKRNFLCVSREKRAVVNTDFLAARRAGPPRIQCKRKADVCA